MPKSIHYLRELVDDPLTVHGRRFMLSIQFLIVVSITAFTLDTLPGRSDFFYAVLSWIEIVTIGIFTLEYILRLLVSEHRIKFVMSFWGIVDLLSIVPFYVFLLVGFDSRPLKALRMLRLLRLFKIFRYNKSIHRFKRALSIAKDDLTLFGAAALVMIYLSGVGVYFLENERQPEQFSSIFDGIWWAIVTLTTVGYGDTFPITAGGRVFTFVILIIGLAIVSIPTGLI
ncbi:MAG: ion transporter, partial [Psychrosphaera sp.]|nr:ion transporter [Psychrosphaera sp.]